MNFVILTTLLPIIIGGKKADKTGVHAKIQDIKDRILDNIEYIKEIDRFAEILKREARNTVKEGLNRSLMIPTLRQLWRIHGYFEISQIYTSRSMVKEKGR